MSARMVPNCLSNSKTQTRLATGLKSVVVPRICTAAELAHVAMNPSLPTPAQLLKKARKKHKKGKAEATTTPNQPRRPSEDGTVCLQLHTTVAVVVAGERFVVVVAC